MFGFEFVFKLVYDVVLQILSELKFETKLASEITPREPSGTGDQYLVFALFVVAKSRS